MTTACTCGAPRDIYYEIHGTWVQCTECSRIWLRKPLGEPEYPTIVRRCPDCRGEFLDDSGLPLESPRLCPDCFELEYDVKRQVPARPPGLVRLLPRQHPSYGYWPYITGVAVVVWLLFRLF